LLLSFAPLGLVHCSTYPPTACAVGCIPSPLCGWSLAGFSPPLSRAWFSPPHKSPRRSVRLRQQLNGLADFTTVSNARVVKSRFAVGAVEFVAPRCLRGDKDLQGASGTRFLFPRASARQCRRTPTRSRGKCNAARRRSRDVRAKRAPPDTAEAFRSTVHPPGKYPKRGNSPRE
jgi:hypothetical protein